MKRILYTIATLIRRRRARRLIVGDALCGVCSAEFSMGNRPGAYLATCGVCRYVVTRWRFDGGRLAWA